MGGRCFGCLAIARFDGSTLIPSDALPCSVLRHLNLCRRHRPLQRTAAPRRDHCWNVASTALQLVLVLRVKVPA
jgi:hypothetical protein